MKRISALCRVYGSLCACSAILACCIFCSCNVTDTDLPFTTETVRIELPPTYPVWTLVAPGKRPSYTICWYDADGSECARHGVTEDTDITLEAGVFTPVLLMPETEGIGIPRGFLPAAGALYPVHVAGAASSPAETLRLETSWNRGITAECAKLVCTSALGGFDTGRCLANHFNWLKFEESLSGRTNPFLLDRARVAEAVLSGTFSKYDISTAPLIEIQVSVSGTTVPAETEFAPAWPDFPCFARGTEPELSVKTPSGVSHYFSRDGILSISAETDGKNAYAFFVPYGLQD